MKKCSDLIAKSDAILVLNHDKNGVAGYVGTSSLMEIGLDQVAIVGFTR